MGEGDGTVSLLSLGAMCVEGWKRKRWNPAGIKIVTVEVSSASKNLSWILLTVSVPLPLLVTSQTRRDYPSRRGLHIGPRRHPRLNAVERGNFEGRDWSGRRSGRKLRIGYPTLREKDRVGLRGAGSHPFVLFVISTSIIRNVNRFAVNRFSLLGSSCVLP